ncbi:hypothetical protein GMD78_03610 [Ornithinibacillus sp. L9]|uniref:Uncharacterized protein n=1 Tax=Ornithinibacillus caprae TaxID=2678566 RepID=A0A6N8FFK9_9BACI|nr:hypothetical protein [Ornithinibacillus caprae]MUK87486.1 hypothetical protein [Ornithinibacillus caprae]
MNSYYEELCHVVFQKHGIDVQHKYTYQNHSLEVKEYLLVVSTRDKKKWILYALEKCETKEQVLFFLRGAITRIIVETLKRTPEYYGSYKDKLIKEIS